MKRPFILLFFLLLFCRTISAQDPGGKIIAFHPSVGNLVDAYEKKHYDIFTEYNDSLFESAQLVRYSDSSYTILVKTKGHDSFEKPAGRQQLDDIYNSIEKISPKITPNPEEREKAIMAEEERRKRERRAEVWGEIGDASVQTLVIFLEVGLYLLDAFN
jgi:hypothetical protein